MSRAQQMIEEWMLGYFDGISVPEQPYSAEDIEDVARREAEYSMMGEYDWALEEGEVTHDHAALLYTPGVVIDWEAVAVKVNDMLYDTWVEWLFDD